MVGDEHLGRHTQLAGHVGDGQAVVAAGRGDQSGGGCAGGPDLLLNAPARFERAGVLKQLQLEGERDINAHGARLKGSPPA